MPFRNLLLVPFLATLCNGLPSVHNIDSHEEKMIKVEALEGIRHDLYDQIKYSIDDSLRALQQINNAEALIGISYIKDLKSRFEKMDSFEGTKFRGNNIFRRHGDQIKKVVKSGKGAARQLIVETDREKLWDLKKVFGDPRNPKYKIREKNRQKVQMDLETWVKERNAAKKKINAYRESTRVTKAEKCTNFGFAKVKVRGKVGQKRKGIVPCCRKCCKSSYMGCLR